MKKIVTKLLCGILLFSVVLCGCNQTTETTEPSVTESQTEVTTTETETETTPAPVETPARPEINVDNMMKVADLYASKKAEGKDFPQIFVDGIRGQGSYYIDNGDFYFFYSAINGLSSIQIRLTSGNRTAGVVYELNYKGKRIYGRADVGIDEFEKFIDDLINNTASNVDVYDDSARANYSENIKKDLPIIYSRFIAVSDKAFPELGLKVEDLGIDLGSKYRSVDPTQHTSMEPTITNSLTYKNGVSTKGKKVWTEYFYKAVGVMGGMSKNKWRSVYGQQSATMLTSSDYVQYSASNKKVASLYYHKMTGSDKEAGEGFTINVFNASTKKKKKVSVSMVYELRQKPISLGKGIYTDKYIYTVTISAKPGKFNKVFASKASLKKYAKVDLFVMSKKGYGTSAWGKKANITKLKKQFAKDKCTYYSKSQIIDLLWARHENFLGSLDSGMTWMDTSLADVGINWKKKS